MHFDRAECLDLEAALARTWLVTDGAGAFAAGTVPDCPTSRRHGLLTAPLPGTGVLHLFLARLEAWVLEGERALPLTSARYPGVLHPGGHAYLDAFDAWPRPRWVHRVGDVVVEREVLLPRPRGPGHTVLVRWRVHGPAAAARRLTLRPLLAAREAGALTVQNAHLDAHVEPVEGGVVVQPYRALPPLSLTLSGAPHAFVPGPDWYRRIEYAADPHPGATAHEDHWTPGQFRVEVGARAEVVLAASTGPAVPDPRALWRTEAASGRARRPSLGAVLARATSDHVVAAGGALGVLDRLPEGGTTALATWEALPGLLLPRGRVEDLGRALRAHADAVAVAPPAGVAAGADALGLSRSAALAWARAAGLYLDVRARPRRGAGAVAAALLALGERLRAEAEGDGEAGGSGLLSGAPEPGPRRLDVLVNARWLGLAQRLARTARGGGGRARRDWAATHRALAGAFLGRFWLEDPGSLASAWLDGAPDPTLTPTVVAALAEPGVPLAREQRLGVLARARAELLTPRGLRALSPREPRYRPERAVSARTVGAYVDACLLAQGRGRAALRRLRALVRGFAPHLGEHGLGHVAEAFDGDAPHAPGGAASDARAVAALAWAAWRLGLAVR